jgi:DNA repair protein RecO (recombination protein O)
VPAVIDQAVCIRRWDWSETSQTVSLFARDSGIIRGIAKGSRRERSPFSGGVEVLTRAEVSAIIKPSSDLATITAWDLQETFPALRRSLSAFYSGMYIADVVHHALHERDPHPALFDALLDALRALGDPATDGLAVLRFQWAALTETGYRPNLDRDAVADGPLAPARTVAFVPRLGGFTQDARSGDAADGRWRVRAETLDLLRRVADPSAADGPAAPDSAQRAARLLDAYFREILGRELPAGAPLFGEKRP